MNISDRFKSLLEEVSSIISNLKKNKESVEIYAEEVDDSTERQRIPLVRELQEVECKIKSVLGDKSVGSYPNLKLDEATFQKLTNEKDNLKNNVNKFLTRGSGGKDIEG